VLGALTAALIQGPVLQEDYRRVCHRQLGFRWPLTGQKRTLQVRVGQLWVFRRAGDRARASAIFGIRWWLDDGAFLVVAVCSCASRGNLFSCGRAHQRLAGARVWSWTAGRQPLPE